MDRFGEGGRDWDLFSMYHALPSWAHSPDLARPSALLSIFIALESWPIHYVLGIFVTQHGPRRCSPSSQPSGCSPFAAC